MNQNEMSAAVRALPTEYLENYSASFEAGIVGSFYHARYCVLGCLGNPVATDSEDRAEGYLKLALQPGPTGLRHPIEQGYEDAARRDTRERLLSCGNGPHQAAYRTALYDACVLELTARASVATPTAAVPV